MDDLDALLAEADEIIANPDSHVYQPLIMLKIMVALAREIRPTPNGGVGYNPNAWDEYERRSPDSTDFHH